MENNKKSKMANKFPAFATLMGTIIGAGILAIPYVIMKSGFIIGLINLLMVAGFILIIYLYLGEISLRTSKNHHIPGYASRYLGKKGKTIALISTIFGIYSALTAYLIGESESLSHLFFSTSSYSPYFAFSFWLILSIISFFGLKALEDFEELGIMFIFILIISLVFLFLNKIDVYNLNYNNLSSFFSPFSVILFAFLGFSAIPEVKRILEHDKKEMKKTIIYSIFSVLIIYTIFTLVVLGVFGSDTSPIATIALGKPFILLGVITMFTAYLSNSNILIDTFVYDFKIKRSVAWLYTTLVPLIIYLILVTLKSDSFIKIIGLGGIISGGITSIIILLIIKKAKKSCDRIPEYSIPYSKILAIAIIILLAIGTIFEIVSFFD